MADKKIIINSVDVGGCEYACNTAFGKNGCKHPMMKNIYCSKNPNCYFKQLSRKTAECQKYENALDEIMKFINRSTCNICKVEDTQWCLECNLNTIKDIISKAKDTNVPHKKDGE